MLTDNYNKFQFHYPTSTKLIQEFLTICNFISMWSTNLDRFKLIGPTLSGPDMHSLLTIYCCMRNQEVGKQLRMDYFLEKSQPADPPNTLRNILPSISVAINAKHKYWFFQLTQFYYLPCNHMIHPIFNRLPIQIEDPSIRSPTHPFNMLSTFHYTFIINTVIC
jgi:hypothetical protein